MGGFVLLNVLTELEKEEAFAGAIILSAYNPITVRTSTKPKLFFVAKDDRNFYPKVMDCVVKAGTPKQLNAFTKGGHGQSLFNSHREEVFSQILSFIK